MAKELIISLNKLQEIISKFMLKDTLNLSTFIKTNSKYLNFQYLNLNNEENMYIYFLTKIQDKYFYLFLNQGAEETVLEMFKIISKYKEPSELLKNLLLLSKEEKFKKIILLSEILLTEKTGNQEESNKDFMKNKFFIKKRDGRLEKFDIDKINKTHLDYAFKGIKDSYYVKRDKFTEQVIKNFKNEMTTEEITQIILQYAIDNIAPEAQEFNLIAARILLKDIEHKIYKEHKLKTYTKEAYEVAKNKYGYKDSYKKYLGETYYEYLAHGIENKVFTNYLTKVYSEETIKEIGSCIEPKKDLNFKYIGIKTLYDRYLKKINDKIFELPQWRFMTVALFLASIENFKGLYYLIEEDKIKLTFYSKLLIEKLLNEKVPDEFETIEEVKKYVATKQKELKRKYKYNLNQQVKKVFAVEFYNILSNFEAMMATPTLNNSGTINHQLSSCFQDKVSDNIEGIMDEMKESAIKSKFGGGIGKEYITRGSSAPIWNKPNIAKNVMAWLKIDNNLMLAVDQLGTRPGSEAAYLSFWHPDLKEFIEMKRKGGEDRLRAYDLFNGVVIPKLFFKILKGEVVLNNEPFTWYLIDPYYTKVYNKRTGLYKDLLEDTWGEEWEKNYIKLVNDKNIPKKKVNAFQLFQLLLNTAYKDGSPFVLFRDNHNKSHQLKDKGPVTASNLCTEMSQYTKENIYGVRFYLEKKLTKEDIEFIKSYKRKFKIPINYGTVNIGRNKEYYVLVPEEIKIFDGKEDKVAKYFTVFDKLFGKFNIKFLDKEILKLGHSVVCNLASINMDILPERREIVSKLVIRMLDNVITLNKFPTYKSKISSERVRAIGVGKMNVYKHIVGNKKIEWDSQAALEELAKVMFDFSKYEIEGSIELAMERGKPEWYKYSEWSKGHCYWLDKKEDLEKIIENKELLGKYEKEAIRLGKLAKKYGIRNLYIQAPAPTGSISLITNCTSGVEAIFKKVWYEENSSGLIPVIAPGLDVSNWEIYKSAYDYNPIQVIKNTAVIQCFVDQSISYNVYIDKSKKYYFKGKEINIENVLLNTYLIAEELGVKSIYYLRSQTPNQNTEEEILDRTFECTSCQ